MFQSSVWRANMSFNWAIFPNMGRNKSANLMALLRRPLCRSIVMRQFFCVYPISTCDLFFDINLSNSWKMYMSSISKYRAISFILTSLGIHRCRSLICAPNININRGSSPIVELDTIHGFVALQHHTLREWKMETKIL